MFIAHDKTSERIYLKLLLYMNFIKISAKFLFISLASLVYAEDTLHIEDKVLKNSIYSDFESYSRIDFLKSDDECMAYFGNIKDNGKAQFLTLYKKGKENFFIKTLCFTSKLEPPKILKEFTISQELAKELLKILSMEMYCRRGSQFNKESNGTNYEFSIRKGTSFECGGISNPYRHSIIAKVCKLSSAIDEEEVRNILKDIKLTEYRISLHIENADIKDVIRKLRIIYPRGVCFEAMSYDTRNAIIEPNYNLTYTDISIKDLLKELSKKYKGYEFHLDKDLWIIVHPQDSLLSFNVPKMEFHNKIITKILSPCYKSHGITLYMFSKALVRKGEKYIHPCDYEIEYLKTSECSFMEFLTILSKTVEKKCSWDVRRNPNTGLIMLTFI